MIAADAGQAALKEASDAAFSAYIRQRDTALYAIGSAIGPHPFPLIVRYFQSVVGREARGQFLSMAGQLPDHVVACVAGTAWIAWKALANPDVRLKPQWLPEGQAFDHSYWIPLLFTVTVGGGRRPITIFTKARVTITPERTV